MRGETGHNTRPHARSLPSFQGIKAWITSQLNEVLICNLSGSLMCLVFIFDLLYMGYCTTMHWRASSRLVQELNVCTVLVYDLIKCFSLFWFLSFSSVKWFSSWPIIVDTIQVVNLIRRNWKDFTLATW